MKKFERDYATDYDLADPELSERWDEIIPELHKSGCPVARSGTGEGYWVINGYHEVGDCAKDWETFSSADGFMVNRPEGMPFFAPAEVDPPLQSQLRAALEPFLRPRAVAPLELVIREHANRLIDGFIEKGECELVSEFANPLPQTVFAAEVAGMPLEDMEYLSTCFSFVGPEQERAADFARGMEKIDAYLRMRQESEPRGDITDALLAFEHEGYDWMGKIGTMSQLTIGGITTTGYAFSGGLYHLATNAEDRRLLAEKPAKLGRAIAEFLRLFLGVPSMARRVTQDTEVAGVSMAKGDRILLSFGAASRDPRVVEEPDRLDITRTSGRHVAFGAGVHRCIGAPLAQVVLRLGYEEFLKRLPDFHVPDDFVPGYETGATRHMVELPLRFEPGTAR